MLKKRQSSLSFLHRMESRRIRNAGDMQQEPMVILLVEDNPAHAELVQRSLTWS